MSALQRLAATRRNWYCWSFKDAQKMSRQTRALPRLAKDRTDSHQLNLWRTRSQSQGQSVVDIVSNIRVDKDRPHNSPYSCCMRLSIGWPRQLASLFSQFNTPWMLE
jgi:hypothetical protein